jgi:hypothetical protein
MTEVLDSSSTLAREQQPCILINSLAGFTQMVKVDGLKLESVPMQSRTYKLCKIAITQNWKALKFTPHCYYTAELFLIASAQNPRAIHYIPESLRSREFFLELLGLNPHALSHFPKEWRNLEMCTLAVTLDGTTWHYVPNHLRSNSLRECAEKSIKEHLDEIVARENKIIKQCKARLDALD